LCFGPCKSMGMRVCTEEPSTFCRNFKLLGPNSGQNAREKKSKGDSLMPVRPAPDVNRRGFFVAAAKYVGTFAAGGVGVWALERFTKSPPVEPPLMKPSVPQAQDRWRNAAAVELLDENQGDEQGRNVRRAYNLEVRAARAAGIIDGEGALRARIPGEKGHNQSIVVTTKGSSYAVYQSADDPIVSAMINIRYPDDSLESTFIQTNKDGSSAGYTIHVDKNGNSNRTESFNPVQVPMAPGGVMNLPGGEIR